MARSYDPGVSDTDRCLVELMRAIDSGDRAHVSMLLDATPGLATATLVAAGATRSAANEFFLEQHRVYMYAGHTALHVAAAAHDIALARDLVAAGADVRARNRRGAEPLHEAVHGAPGTGAWNPQRQAEMVRYLIGSGADPDAVAAGGVTALHRAVRNRCAAAVQELLDNGADPHRSNDRGSTAIMLAHWTTGKSGSGSPEARAEQAKIVQILERVAG